MKINFNLIVLFIAGSIVSGCPNGFDYITPKCYRLGAPLSQTLAKSSCKNDLAGEHLWIVNSEEEYIRVVDFYFPGLAPTPSPVRSGSYPAFWTDGIFNSEGVAIWSETNTPISYIPPAGVNQACCIGNGCSTGTWNSGNCIAVGNWSDPSNNGMVGFLGCRCDETVLPFICESPDVGDFTCPDDGQFASGPCSEQFWNCFGGTAEPDYCSPGMVFNGEAGYCDFPSNVEGCQTTTVETTVML